MALLDHHLYTQYTKQSSFFFSSAIFFLHSSVRTFTYYIFDYFFTWHFRPFLSCRHHGYMFFRSILGPFSRDNVTCSIHALYKIDIGGNSEVSQRQFGGKLEAMPCQFASLFPSFSSRTSLCELFHSFTLRPFTFHSFRYA